MRYREGDTADQLSTLDDTVFMGVAIFVLIMGIGFVLAGLRGRQYWLLSWGIGLVIASIVYIIYLL